MPYIKCKDGKIYSRYNQSSYVKKCILEEKQDRQKAFNSCMLDKTCKENYENEIKFGQYFVIVYIIFCVVFIIALLKELKKNL